MKKLLLFTATTLVLLVVTFAVPLRRGEPMNCDDGVIERMQLTGFPFAFSKAPNAGDMICSPKSQQRWSTRLAAMFKGDLL